MDQLTRLQESIGYIEDNLENAIEIDELAQIAAMSRFHFQRMFHILVNIPVGEYIRHRRLTRAAGELISTDARVIDLAFKYGYETPEAFSTAFRRFHGVSPSSARQTGTSLRTQPKVAFHVEIVGGFEMEYRIEEHPAFTTVGHEIRTSTAGGENLSAIPAFWRDVSTDGRLGDLEKLVSDDTVYGICISDANSSDEMSYVIAIRENGRNTRIDADVAEGRLVRSTVPSATWAIFDAIGPVVDSIQETWRRIFAEWFPSTNYEHAGGPELEVYFTDQDPASPDHRCEVWIPIKTR